MMDFADFGQPIWSIGIQEGLELVASDHTLVSGRTMCFQLIGQ